MARSAVRCGCLKAGWPFLLHFVTCGWDIGGERFACFPDKPVLKGFMSNVPKTSLFGLFCGCFWPLFTPSTASKPLEIRKNGCFVENCARAERQENPS